MSHPAASTPQLHWLELALSRTWPGSSPARVIQLRGDASTRQFWRVWIKAGGEAATAIAVDLGTDILPLYARVLTLYREPLDEPPYLNVHRFLESIGAPVPGMYCAIDRRFLLVEDVGDKSLFQAATANPERAPELYRAAIDELLRIHVDGTSRRDDRCMAFGVNYDRRLFGWELEQFTELGLKEIAPEADPAPIQPELAELAARLGKLPRVLSHRDYHGGNLFVQDSAEAIRIRILDFQDALMAPAAQDLALLLTTRDAARVITPAIEAGLLDYYLDGLARKGAPHTARAEFFEGYRLCVIQHALKMVGRFVWLERQGRSGYASYVPHAAAQARRMLTLGAGFPCLKAALRVVR